ncbi:MULTISPECIES: tRNA (adenosine(37)-N6)-threonylcarbamoyltransferase complex dimerization subunit type 1 TsaB [unclassified Rhizobium]|uniref:tRNA (adenosine(37)-N6)-threonylcarbamoyltransferase complex dimerization subunit type 1 TsaB n=1 Tax=unclassified Rhizobium TaxID=2613769 RepID=UPI000366B997|nr:MULTISPECIES: tRNA (adenosine(37)-N6)-threonylcarbamoyltransferase complex dimerization subunit type 1 TsaB [unclassified Rhizobium]MBD9444645.1 tRNA (adenosine(37)-N6)-threonylcarbamoyltransferase complex dimerization subunit type 1 TsaB [Rhizobium sp. RHZ01]MBD9451583.1 tRNA (adenosine(37)-N6)-threonylcarbamoyltransferase complex dimerization subunit type 1 TsaB [Rhizobium sp. RHZ02]NMN68361.1 tRNA threonylcarbamoyl adenosine modification protein YeaZ [Rhizobium sp. 57MFTsu3.2]
MIILALDTAGVDCAAALYDSGRNTMLGEASDMIGKGHAEHLMGIVDRAMDKAGLALSAVDRIAVTIGPGSFTGIRVGVAAARGFALSLGVPAVGITTLAVMAEAQRQKTPGRPVLTAMDAKRNEIYLQAFNADGEPLDEARAVTVEEAQTVAAAFDGEITGSATPLLKPDATGDHANHFPISLVARLGADADPSAGKPKPLYLRGPDAKPQAGFAIARV